MLYVHLRELACCKTPDQDTWLAQQLITALQHGLSVCNRCLADLHALTLQVPRSHNRGASYDKRSVEFMPMIPSRNPLHTGSTSAEHRAVKRTNAQRHAIDPRTGAEMRYGPAMADKAVGIELPALRRLFADIRQ